ncbi:MAG: GNAT family N-acetyltransferase, partial [Armatimonadota bacterium]
MKILVDTNIIIPLEPSQASDLLNERKEVLGLARILSENGNQMYIHPHIIYDIERDKDENRKALRRDLIKKYPELPSVPSYQFTPEEISAIGDPERTSNDWVDNQLLIAVKAQAVDYLITEDQRIYKKAKALSIQNQILNINEAIETFAALYGTVTPKPPPAVRSIYAYDLDASDHIFDSFRLDYPGFDEWLSRCKHEHRQAWIIENHDSNLAAICMVNQEKNALNHLAGKKLKICSFKVSDQYMGLKYGELILKTVFDYATKNDYEYLYITVLPKYVSLINLISDFGFKLLEERLG